MDLRELTPGEKSAGVDFNPGGKPEVDAIKKKSAELLDELYTQQAEAIKLGNFKKVAFYEQAIMDIISGQMFAVKACTWKY